MNYCTETDKGLISRLEEQLKEKNEKIEKLEKEIKELENYLYECREQLDGMVEEELNLDEFRRKMGFIPLNW